MISLSLQSIINLILVCGFLYLSIAGILIAIKILNHFSTKNQKRKKTYNEQLLLNYLSCATPSPPRVKPDRVLQDTIINMARLNSGEYKTRLMLLYHHLGFTKIDSKNLNSLSLAKKINAIERCRVLDIPMPDEVFHKHIKSKNLVFRWMLMEYVIHLKGKKSLPLVISYLFNQNQRNHRGITLHLLCCLAEKSPESIPFLLDHCDDLYFKEIILHVFTIYPVAGQEELILSQINSNFPEELIIAAVKALVSNPSISLLHAIKELAQHQNWVIRMIAIKSLTQYPVAQVRDCLEAAILDVSYHVRLNAIKTIISFQPELDDLISEVISEKMHPSHEILNLALET